MSAKGGGSLATFLFSIPLAAIPLMAIFGIPQFAPVVAGPNAGDDAPSADRDYRSRAADLLSPYEDRELSQPLSDAPAYDGGSVDLGAPGSSRREPADAERRPQGFPEESQPDESPLFDAESVHLDADHDGSAGTHDPWADESNLGAAVEEPASPASPASTSLTWREASRQLAEMGIEDYHLERGGADGAFLFVCSFAPAGAAHVTMRFEAESEDPLLAVADVLGQVDRWLRQRYAESRVPGSAAP